MVMKLDLLYEVDVPRPWPGVHPYGQRKAEQEAYRDSIAQIRLADQMGFYTTWHVEHHFREGRSHSPAPEVLIGALSQVTERIRLGFGVVLMPHGFTSPVRVAEKVATADVLSNGRVEWGTGRSTPMEQTAFGVDPVESKAQAQEAIQAVVQAWESEYFSFHGKYWDFPAFDNVPVRMVTPKPFQDPHPPCWMAASSDSSAAVAGSLGLGVLSLSIMRPVEQMAETIRQYREASQNAKPITRVLNNRAAVYTLVHCADTMAQAEANGIWDATWWWYSNLAKFTLDWEFPNFPQEDKDRMFPLLSAGQEGVDPRSFSDADMIIVGDPDQCLTKMLRYAELGVDELLCYVQFGHLPHESVMRTIELLGQYVIPELEKRDIQVRTTGIASP
jgi:alkanesulfonate monooxygenase SsuD/methylene tetrahydromethanopterin reductase-like flavin-dependent oxidoreductase (luciferase family)